MLQTIYSLFGRDSSFPSGGRRQLQVEAHLLQTTLKLLSLALLLVTFMPKQESPEARLTAILQEQQKLVYELRDATPARKLQIQAEIVSLTEEQAKLLQEAGTVTCFIFSSSNTRGTGWIEEERNYDGSVRQYRYGYYRNGKSNRRYLSKFLVPDVQRMIASKASPEAIIEFLDKSKTRVAAKSSSSYAVKTSSPEDFSG
jgi:hypothetical protein